MPGLRLVRRLPSRSVPPSPVMEASVSTLRFDSKAMSPVTMTSPPAGRAEEKSVHVPAVYARQAEATARASAMRPALRRTDERECRSAHLGKRRLKRFACMMIPPLSGLTLPRHSTEHGRARRNPPAAFVSLLRLASPLRDLFLQFRYWRPVVFAVLNWVSTKRRRVESLPSHHTIRLPLLSSGFRECRRQFSRDEKPFSTAGGRLRETEHLFTVRGLYYFKIRSTERNTAQHSSPTRRKFH